MGQAKRRGTFEQRLAEALKRKQRIGKTIEGLFPPTVAKTPIRTRRAMPSFTLAAIAASLALPKR